MEGNHVVYGFRQFLKKRLREIYPPRLREEDIHVSDLTSCLYRAALSRIRYIEPLPISASKMMEGVLWEELFDEYLRDANIMFYPNKSYRALIKTPYTPPNRLTPLIGTPDVLFDSEGVEVKRTLHPLENVIMMLYARYDAHIPTVYDVVGHIYPRPEYPMWDTYYLQVSGYLSMLNRLRWLDVFVIYDDDIKRYRVERDMVFNRKMVEIKDAEGNVVFSVEANSWLEWLYVRFMAYEQVREDIKKAWEGFSDAMDKIKALYYYEMTDPIGIMQGVFCTYCPYLHAGICRGRLPVHTRMTKAEYDIILPFLQGEGIIEEVRAVYRSTELHEAIRRQYEYARDKLSQYPYELDIDILKSKVLDVSIESVSEVGKMEIKGE